MMNNIKEESCAVHLAITDQKFNNQIMKIINYLKNNKIPFFWNYKYNLKKSLTKANSSKAKFIIIIGEEEFKNDIYTVKKLKSGDQYKIDIDQIKNFINDKT